MTTALMNGLTGYLFDQYIPLLSFMCTFSNPKAKNLNPSLLQHECWSGRLHLTFCHLLGHSRDTVTRKVLPAFPLSGYGSCVHSTSSPFSCFYVTPLNFIVLQQADICRLEDDFHHLKRR